MFHLFPLADRLNQDGSVNASAATRLGVHERYGLRQRVVYKPRKSLSVVNCAERGPPGAYSALCPFPPAPPPASTMVVLPGHTLPKI
jgi:hypothetical protein